VKVPRKVYNLKKNIIFNLRLFYILPGYYLHDSTD